MLAQVRSYALLGLEAVPVTVEVDVSPGLPSYALVGLPDKAVEESRERVRSALKNSGLPYPQARVVVNLAPAELRKEGSQFDLPIALGLLAAQGVVPPEALAPFAFAGELGLDGSLRPVPGAVNLALGALGEGKKLLLPKESAKEAALVEGVEKYTDATGPEVEAACADYQPLAETGGLTLRADLPPHEVTVYADPERLRVVLDNLISNAVKFTPAGGRVRVALARLGGEAADQLGRI